MKTRILAVATVGLLASAVRADVDNISQLIAKSVATSSAVAGSPLLQGATIADAVYDEHGNLISPEVGYTSSSGSASGFQLITKLGPDTNGNPQTPSGSQIITAGDLQLFYRGGDPNNSVTTPLDGSIRLNPATLNFSTFTAAPNTVAFISDLEQTKNSSGTLDPATTERLYMWNLNASGTGHDPVLTLILNRQTYNAAAGVVGSTANDAMGMKQFAFSADGQSIYFTDSTATFGGIYRTNIVTGATVKLVSDRSSGSGVHLITAEAGVENVNGVSRVFFDGSSATGNVGGLNYFDDTGTATPAVHTLVDAATLSSFVNSTAVMTVGSVVADQQGNVYFSIVGGIVTDGSRRVALLRLDPQGHLSKVISFNDEFAYFSSSLGLAAPGSGFTRLELHTAADGTPLINFVEKNGGVLQTKAYLPGDFNRDGAVDSQDAAIFDKTSVLSVRNATTTNTNLFKFDLNADSNANDKATPTAVVDYADVKIFQQFYKFANGDANMDGAVNALDFNALATNYGGGSDVWVQGDFNGDNTVNSADFDILAGNFGVVSPLPSSGAAANAAIANAALANTLGSVVPEPASLVLLPLAGLLLQRRARRITVVTVAR